MSTVAERNTAIAKKLLEKYHFKTSRDTGITYLYDDVVGTYSTDAETYIAEETQRMLGDFVCNHSVSEVTGFIERATFLGRDDEFDYNPDLLVVGNGVLNLKTRELLPHSPDYLAMRSVSVDYDPKATCPKATQVIMDNLSPDDADEFVKFLGYLLMPDNRYKRALALVGPRDTGKTTLLDMVLNMIGAQNVSNEKIQRLCDSRFSEFELVGKMANVRDDVEPVTLDNAETIKSLTGDFGITKVEQKNVQKRTAFRNRAKLMFTANLLPMPRRPDPIFFGRWVLVEMRREYHFGDATVDRADVDLKDKLKQESSGVFNLALRGMDALVKSNGFRVYSDDVATMRYTAYAGDSIGRFLQERVVRDPSGVVAKGNLFGFYEAFCNKRNEPTRSDEDFKKMLLAIFPGVLDGWIGNSKAWRGISVRSEGDRPFVPRFNYPVSIKPSDFSEEKQ